MEATYAMHDNSPLKLYDSLVPKIRDHMRAVGINCESCREKAQDKGLMAFPITVEELRLTN